MTEFEKAATETSLAASFSMIPDLCSELTKVCKGYADVLPTIAELMNKLLAAKGAHTKMMATGNYQGEFPNVEACVVGFKKRSTS